MTTPRLSTVHTLQAFGWVLELEVARRDLSAQEVLDVVRAEIKERTAAADEYERIGRADEVSRLKAEAAALESFLEAAVEAT